jgi:hypothetical protein
VFGDAFALSDDSGPCWFVGVEAARSVRCRAFALGQEERIAVLLSSPPLGTTPPAVSA